ncbi:hypothetical protein M0L20_29075 [Spirosoma sp. RP8]|uniref:Uncharacterized protein n=2 Tax=Cytophagaceae TaxID=89373 RepID=A0ABT0HUX9_9BACT|nr:hypothetical protein [Spirosoma liriopis]
MNRYSVLYLLEKQYHAFYCSTQSEAMSALALLSDEDGHTPLGIYDAKTELFDWEPTRQNQYAQASIEEQGKLGNQIIQIAQGLRQQDEMGQTQTSPIPQLVHAKAA